MLIRDKDAAKTFLQPYVGLADPEVLESTWKYAADTLERVPHPDPEGIKVVLQDRARTRPEIGKLNPEQFIDGSVILELEKEGFYKKLYSR